MDTIDFMNEKFPPEPNKQPDWLMSLHTEIIHFDCTYPMKIFIIKIILNRFEIV